jgi:hypothetical protein
MSATATKTSNGTLRHGTAWAAAELGVNERTVRRYIVGGYLGCDVLPGGHYRITDAHIRECRERALDSKRRYRERTPAPVPASEDAKLPRERRPARHQRPRLRRPALGQQPPPSHFDLSADALARLRSRYAPREDLAFSELQPLCATTDGAQ